MQSQNRTPNNQKKSKNNNMTLKGLASIVNLTQMENIELKTRTGLSIVFTIRADVLKQFGDYQFLARFEVIDKIDEHYGQFATVIGVPKDTKHPQKLWFILDEDDGLSYWSKLDSTILKKLEESSADYEFVSPILQAEVLKFENKILAEQQEIEKQVLKKLEEDDVQQKKEKAWFKNTGSDFKCRVESAKIAKAPEDVLPTKFYQLAKYDIVFTNRGAVNKRLIEDKIAHTAQDEDYLVVALQNDHLRSPKK